MANGTSTPDGIIRNREVDPAVLTGGPWDGRNYGYIPAPDRTLSPSVKLHEEFDTQLDPISYQVVRNRFWNLNLDHSDTIKRVSGSPLIVYMDDFNTSLLTENGDSVVCGPSIQYFTGHGDHVVKWTLEHRGENPGIEDGDVFFQNDPYIGTAHQPDAAVYAPIFWDGKLFCWVFSCCHVGDLGGTVPGSFVPEAPDIFFEATPVPPVKLVRAGETQRDIAELIARKSRLPDLLALQLRSQIAGIKVTRNRVEELLEEHGPSFVKGVMRRIIRDCSAAVGERLSRIPDGSWQERIFIGSAGPEDREAHRLVTTVEKRGDRLIFANEGTDPQFSAANCTYGAWRSANVCAVSAMLAWDQRYCPAGVADHLEFVPTPDTLSVATYPGAVSPVTGAVVVVYLASQVLSKMLLAGPDDLRRRANASGGTSLPGWWVAAGTDRNGKFVAEVTGDSLNGSLGAFPFRDGVDTGGAWYWPRSTSGNVEGWEQSAPILYLYRREQIDSGGAGVWRGGNGCELSVIAHKSSDLAIAIISTDPAVNCSPGLAGGNPGHSGNHLLATGRSVRELLGSGAILASKEDLERQVGKVERLSPKAAFVLSQDEAFIAEYPAGGGYGSPFARDPDAVLADVHELRLSRERALGLYGVAIGEDGTIDAAATEQARADHRGESLARAKMPESRQGRADLDQAKVVAAPWQGLLMLERDGDRLWACSACGELLGPAAGDYKAAAAIYDRNPAEVDAEIYPEPSQFCDDPIVFRQTLCPGCGELFNTEICRAEDPVAWDLRLGSVGGGPAE